MIIETHGLTRAFKKKIAVDDLNLSIEAGESIGSEEIGRAHV